MASTDHPSPPPTPPARPPPPVAPAYRLSSSLTRKTWLSCLRHVQRATKWIFFRELPWLQYAAPSLLRPDFTWGYHILTLDKLSTEIPPAPALPSQTWLWVTWHFHSLLRNFSRYYCRWFGFQYSHVVVPLPFGLILKRSDGTSLDEARSMAAARAAGIPAPKVISVGENSKALLGPVSILMTRLPGEEFDEVYHDLEPTQRDNIVAELRTILDIMRSWKNPWNQRICSISGRSIRSIRVPNHRMGPCESEGEFNDYLISAAWSGSFDTREEYQAAVATAQRIYKMPHRVVFTHGDFALHNVMVHDGHISGFIDWECAGWYPEYWEFTTPMRWPSRDPEGGAFFRRLGGDRYEEELEAEKALMSLTIDSWVCM